MKKGSKHTEEAKLKIRAYRHTDEAKKRISETCKEKGIGKWNRGKVAWNKGISPSLEQRKKISDSLKGRKMPWVAEANRKRNWSEATRKKRSLVMKKIIKNLWSKKSFRDRMTGENSSVWIKDRTVYQERCRLRGTKEWNDWRKKIFERDKYTCQECGDKSSGKLEPHHIIPIRSDMDKLFDTNNGITLCRPCHQKTIWKEESFQEKYFKIIKALDKFLK